MKTRIRPVLMLSLVAGLILATCVPAPLAPAPAPVATAVQTAPTVAPAPAPSQAPVVVDPLPSWNEGPAKTTSSSSWPT